MTLSTRGLKLVGLVMLAGASHAAAQAAGQPAGSQPSILFAIADDWGYPNAGVYGDKVVRTPNFDRLAGQGVLFKRAYCVTPSCTPSRASILTGRPPHQLEEGGNLWGSLPREFKVYPNLLEKAGYVVGCTRKGWGPGNHEAGGRTRNPAGPGFRNFAEFLKTVPADRPFSFWFGSHDPHRPYEAGSGITSGLRPQDVVVPPFLPDTPAVRSDLLDYYAEVERFDREVGELLKQLEAAGRAENTLVVVTSDNGMPFPRAKANLYEAGTHLPLAIRWPAGLKGGRVVDELVSFTDFAPTFLQAAGLQAPKEMVGRSLLGLLADQAAPGRDRVFLERERHANVRAGNLSYPSRAIRTREFLYIRNLRPQLWPAGDPEREGAMGVFGDIDASPTKQLLLDRRDDPAIARFFRLACEKRPAEELYDLAADPDELNNLADKPEFADAKRRLRTDLDRWMKDTADPRAAGEDARWDNYPYYGGGPATRPR